MRQRILIFFLCWILSTVAFTSITPAAEPSQVDFSFGTASPPDTFTHKYQKVLLTEAFKRNGLQLHVIYIPNLKEMTSQVNQMILDGDVHRVGSLTGRDGYPGYVRINFSTHTLEWGAYACSPLPVKGWKSLSTLGMTVGYRKGNFISKKNLTGTVPPRFLHEFQTQLDGFKALAAGEIAVFVMANQYTAQEFLCSKQFSDSGIRLLCVLSKKNMYAYFSKKHAALAPRIAKTLKNMKQQGFFEKTLLKIMGQ
ncbi:substrate-binding periplasmic protein [Pseudodesulfovibrio piezophilus]|uniref:Solute-binding protein family 3/N-terminal domain-containing protein n=1 Tax=Pseudodesulfovibrio piezophilus (strain DSM 21447 / JCM 15486 / C1TLV30) TaxID=1322246 RepID=M1WQN6_PSEP2|nr:hypothetical protein [Pseudodesulfovibrio piezophilus]CCH49074.1 exported protein of unknown function [Pseudodesulfovibrio piezophilus C1TLV30]